MVLVGVPLERRGELGLRQPLERIEPRFQWLRLHQERLHLGPPVSHQVSGSHQPGPPPVLGLEVRQVVAPADHLFGRQVAIHPGVLHERRVLLYQVGQLVGRCFQWQAGPELWVSPHPPKSTNRLSDSRAPGTRIAASIGHNCCTIVLQTIRLLRPAADMAGYWVRDAAMTCSRDP